MVTNKQIEVGTIVYSNTWRRHYKVAEINASEPKSDDYILLKWQNEPPWHCDKETWDCLLRLNDTVILPADTQPKQAENIAGLIKARLNGLEKITEIKTLKNDALASHKQEVLIKCSDCTEFHITIVRTR